MTLYSRYLRRLTNYRNNDFVYDLSLIIHYILNGRLYLDTKMEIVKMTIIKYPIKKEKKIQSKLITDNLRSMKNLTNYKALSFESFA